MVSYAQVAQRMLVIIHKSDKLRLQYEPTMASLGDNLALLSLRHFTH